MNKNKPPDDFPELKYMNTIENEEYRENGKNFESKLKYIKSTNAKIFIN